MNPAGRTIAKNAGFLMASQVVTWGLALVATIFLPRYLGAAGLGRFQLAISVWAIMSIVIGFGMDTLLAKEISRDPNRVSELLATSVLLRTGIFLASFALTVVYAQAAGYPQETRAIIYIIGLSTLIWQVSLACGASLQGLERMEFISLSSIAAKGFSTTLTIIFLLKGYSLLLIAFVEVGSALISLVVQYFALNRIQKLQLSFDRHLLVWMLKTSFPYLILSGFLVAYGQIDIIIISLLVSEKQIGWYSVATRLTGTFVFIPTVFMAALLPASSRMHKNAPEDLRRLMSKSFDLLLLVCIPIGFGVMILSSQLVLNLYGSDFVTSGPILAVMGVVVIFFSLNMFVAQFFISSDRQNVWIVAMAVSTVMTIPLDLVLVPWCQKTFGIGALGGSLSYLLTESGIVVFGLVMLPKGMLSWKNGWLAVRMVIAGLAMAAVVWWVRGLFIAIPVGIGITVYLVLILVLRVISQEDWALFEAMSSSITARLRGARPPKPVLSED